MHRLISISFVLILFVLGGCSIKNEEPNFHYVPLRIVSADLPDSFELNQTYQIDITYVVPNGCTAFNHIQVPKTDTTEREVVVFGIERTDQEFCTQAIEEKQTSFNFVCIYNQTYIFRFWQGENADGEQEYIEVEVPISG